jgi:hypothetical protein
MKKVLVAVILIIVLAIVLTIREEGVDKAFGGAFAPVDSVRADDVTTGRDPLGSLATAQSVPAPSQTDYSRRVDSVRSRVDDAMERSVDRASGRR